MYYYTTVIMDLLFLGKKIIGNKVVLNVLQKNNFARRAFYVVRVLSKRNVKTILCTNSYFVHNFANKI